MKAGLLRLRAVAIDGAVAGVYHGLQHGTRAYAYLGGFDAAFVDESPGALVMADAIEAAVEEGATELDLLRGQEPYKYGWGARDRWNVRRTLVFAG